MAVIKIKTPTGWRDLRIEPTGSIQYEAWRTVGAPGQPAFQNSWTNFDANLYPVQFRKRPDGVVEFRGLARGGVAGSAMFTLPVGYRPAGQSLIFIPTTFFVGGVVSSSRLDITASSGVVAPFLAVPGGGDYVALNGGFPTDQAQWPVGMTTPPQWKWITPVELFNHGVGTVAGTTKSIAANTGTDTAKIAIIRAGVGGVAPGAGFVSNTLTFRRATVSGPLQQIPHTHAGAGTGSVSYSQLLVPLDPDESFVYDRIDNIASSSVFYAALEGYII